MKPNRRNILLIIIINIVLGLIVLAVPIRIWQSQQVTIKETAARETKLAGELTQSIKNFTELEEMYSELKKENMELKEQSDIVWQEFICTGYSDNDGEQGTNNIVATNFNLDYTRVKNLPIIATDPEVIPLYSIVEIKDMGSYISLDVGGAIKGNRIDILFDSKDEALEFGVKELEVRVIR